MIPIPLMIFVLLACVFFASWLLAHREVHADLARAAVCGILAVALGITCTSSARARPGDDVVSRSITAVLLDRLTYPSTVRAGNPRQVWHCRKAVDGCASRLAAFDTFFHDATADKAFANDPWLLAAMAVKESGLNPFAVGDADELGLLQIHPKNKHAKALRFHRSEEHRQKCRQVVGACQAEVVEAAAAILDASIEACGGDVAKGLGMYNVGRCDDSVYYARRVLQIHGELLAARDNPEGQQT